MDDFPFSSNAARAENVVPRSMPTIGFFFMISINGCRSGFVVLETFVIVARVAHAVLAGHLH